MPIYGGTLKVEIVSSESSSNLSPRAIAPEVSSATTIAVLNQVLPVDCSNNTVLVTPPLAPMPGDIFAVSDSRGNALTNNISIDFVGASQFLHGRSQNDILNNNADYREYLYINAVIGWVRK